MNYLTKVNFNSCIKEGTTVLKNKKEITSISDLKVGDNILVQVFNGYAPMIVGEINGREGKAFQTESKFIAFLKYDDESWVCNLLLDGRIFEN